MAERTVLITGASSGIGAEAASRLAARGFRVFGTSRRPTADANPEIEWVALDVGDEASVAGALAEVASRADNLDAVVCCAGFGIFGSVEEVEIDAAQRQFDTNFFGVLRVLRGVLPGLRAAAADGRDARIVLVGSLAGRAPIPFQAHYSASKAAIDALALSLRSELHSFGVRVSLVEPGDINTPFNDAMEWPETSGSPYRGKLEQCERVIRESLPKAPAPEVVARAIEKALTARSPRVRYTAGADSFLVPLGRRLLPDWITLRMIRSHFRV